MKNNLKSFRLLVEEAHKINQKRMNETISQSELLSIEQDILDFRQQIASSPGDFKSNATWVYYTEELRKIASRIRKLSNA